MPTAEIAPPTHDRLRGAGGRCDALESLHAAGFRMRQAFSRASESCPRRHSRVDPGHLKPQTLWWVAPAVARARSPPAAIARCRCSELHCFSRACWRRATPSSTAWRALATAAFHHGDDCGVRRIAAVGDSWRQLRHYPIDSKPPTAVARIRWMPGP